MPKSVNLKRRDPPTLTPDDSSLQIIEAQIVEPDPQIASGQPCRACGCPRDPGSRFCVACGLPFEVPKEPLKTGTGTASLASPSLRSNGPNVANETRRTPVDLHAFRCETCGAEVTTESDQRSLNCPFCDSNYVVELPERSTGKQRPEFIIGFRIDRNKALELFFAWLGRNGWFRPGDLKHAAISDKQRGVYLPFWHFSVKADSRWSASIGEHWYRTETYTYKDSDGKTHTGTRQVQETEWWNLAGNHHKYYYGYLVSASKGLPQREAMAIQPFQLQALVRFQAFFLAGWMSEEYSVQPQEALVVAEQEFRRRQEQAIAAFLPGDTYRNLNISTELESSGSDLILLPVHVLSYRYKGKVYRFLVNGQTGAVYGEKPWSAARISIAVLLIMIMVAIAVIAIIAISNR